jgi:membrane protein implicated in regulation of membrane protease activity
MPANYWWIWGILAALFIVAEILTAGFFLLWFGVGAGVAALLAYLNLGMAWQLVAFIVVSLVLFIWSRRFADRVTVEQPPGIGADRLVGRTGMALENIDNSKNTGRVRLDREEWRAESETGAVITSGAPIEVTRVSGAHVVVKVLEQGD